MQRIISQNRFKTWEIVTLTSISVATTMLLLLFAHGLTETGVLLTIRATGRMSFPLFLMLSLSGSLYKLIPTRSAYWLLANRKYLGLAFAIVYLYHALGFTTLIIMTREPNIEGLELILSIICYGFLVAMTVTSFRTIRRRISPWLWNSLHGIGMLFFWYFFLQEFMHRAEENPMLYLPMALMTAAVLPIKLIAATKPEKQIVQEVNP
jgi:methionine sulfoxide reductase heme-binding subunit